MFITQNVLHEETQARCECPDGPSKCESFCLTNNIFFAIVLISILIFAIPYMYMITFCRDDDVKTSKRRLAFELS